MADQSSHCGVSAAISAANRAASRRRTEIALRYKRRTTANAIATALTANAPPGIHADHPIRQAQQMRVGIWLLVGTPRPRHCSRPVLDNAVVAHLRELQVREVLADALINLLVVVNAIRARRNEAGSEPIAEHGNRGHARQVGATQFALETRHTQDGEGEADCHTAFERPELPRPSAVHVAPPAGVPKQPAG